MASPAHIMIGNDSPEYGLTYRFFLLEQGFRVTLTPRNGDLILEEIRRLQPDIVIMDAHMKPRGALSIINSIALDPDTRQPGYIITSNVFEQEMAEELLNAGANYFLKRPFETKELIKLVNELCGIRYQGSAGAEKRETEKLPSSTLSLIDYLIIQVFTHIRVPMLMGYDALKDAVKMQLVYGKQPMTKIVYPQLAAKYNTTWKLTERRFRHIIHRLWEIGDIAVLNQFFGKPDALFLCDPPSNSQFISALAEHVKLLLLQQGIQL